VLWRWYACDSAIARDGELQNSAIYQAAPGVTRHADHTGRRYKTRPIHGQIHQERPRCHAPLCLEINEDGVHLTVED
jgi:hypothetical protein